jgi:hypothetical protein
MVAKRPLLSLSHKLEARNDKYINTHIAVKSNDFHNIMNIDKKHYTDYP